MLTYRVIKLGGKYKSFEQARVMFWEIQKERKLVTRKARIYSIYSFEYKTRKWYIEAWVLGPLVKNKKETQRVRYR